MVEFDFQSARKQKAFPLLVHYTHNIGIVVCVFSQLSALNRIMIRYFIVYERRHKPNVSQQYTISRAV